MLSPVQLKPKQSGGKGGLWGKIAGGALGLGAAVAAPFTAGTSLAAIPAAMGAAGVAAPIIGNAIDPAKQSGGRGVQTLETAAKQSPMVQKRQLLDLQKDIEMATDIGEDKKRKLDSIFNPALDILGRA